jgi:DNA-binding MarR family transcriptional regulator
LEITQLETDKVKESYNTQVCTVDDLIKAYGRQGEIRRFCHECADWKTCKGTKWSTCPHRKYYIKEEVKGKYQPKVSRYKRLTKEQKENIISMYREGKWVCKIARITGIKPQTVQNIVRNLKDFRYKRTPIDWNKYDNRIIESVKKGVVIRKLTEELGLSQYQIYERVKKLKQLGLIENKDYRDGERMVRKNVNGCRR